MSREYLPHVWMEGDERKMEERMTEIYLKLVHSMNLPLYSPFFSLHLPPSQTYPRFRKAVLGFVKY
jgi:hypothetical protein